MTKNFRRERLKSNLFYPV